MIGLDTNVLIRYLSQDDAGQSAIATRLIERTLTSEDPGFVSLVVLAEIAWVLDACYKQSRQEIGSLIERLLRANRLKIENISAAWLALRKFRSGPGDFADCLIARIGVLNGCEQILTFDQGAARGAGMQLLS